METSQYATFDTNTGIIYSTGSCLTKNLSLQTLEEPGIDVIEHNEEISDSTHYIDVSNQNIIKRQIINPSISTSKGKVTLSHLPNPITINWNNQSAEVIGSVATIEFDEPGEYILTLEAGVKYLPTEIKVDIP